MSKSKEVYLGKCNTITTAYGTMRKISFGPKDLEKLAEFANENKGWVNILVKMKKSHNAGESDFYVEMDTWKPSPDTKPLPF